MRTPKAIPRPRRNQLARIFIPGGYTPARKNPVRNRSAIPNAGPRENIARLALAAAPRHAEAAKRRRVEKTSGRFAKAERSVPATKPSCTARVSQVAADSERFHSTLIAGATAEPENQSDIPSSSAAAMETRARHRAGDSSVRAADSPAGDSGFTGGRMTHGRFPSFC
jgi:hypothetical protein